MLDGKKSDSRKAPVTLVNDDETSLLDNFCSSCSSGDCTGLIPAGGSLTEEEYENYKTLYPFATPMMPEQY